MEIKDGVALVRLAGGKANAMDPALLDNLVRLFGEAEKGGARAIVLTGYERYFSGGLALPALIGLDRPAMRKFMELFSEAMLRVFTSPLPVVAAINGHAIAGGCVLALQCDWRVMAEGESKIGLNEVQLGISLPTIVTETLRLVVPPSALLPVALEGGLFLPSTALELGLVDELVAPPELESRARAKALALSRLPSEAFAATKASLRRSALETIRRVQSGELEGWLDTWFSPAGRQRLGEVVAKLSR